MPTQKKILILGCGYLGRQLLIDAQNLGFTVDTLTRNPETCHSLQSIGANKTLAYHLDDASWHTKISAEHYHAIILCVGSSESTEMGYQKSYIHGLSSAISWMQRFKGKILYTSSISVYGDEEGAEVNENTTPKPQSWRGEIILKSESILTKAKPEQTYIFRLGGIYGMTRNTFLQNRGRRNNQSNTDYYLNLIHLEDASLALLSCIQKTEITNKCFNLTDNHPVLRSELDHFTQSLQSESRNCPSKRPTNRNRKNPANRRIDSSRIQRELNWKPKYSLVIEAITQML